VCHGSYEAFVVYCFVTLMLEYAGGDRSVRPSACVALTLPRLPAAYLWGHEGRSPSLHLRAPSLTALAVVCSCSWLRVVCGLLRVCGVCSVHAVCGVPVASAVRVVRVWCGCTSQRVRGKNRSAGTWDIPHPPLRAIPPVRALAYKEATPPAYSFLTAGGRVIACGKRVCPACVCVPPPPVSHECAAAVKAAMPLLLVPQAGSEQYIFTAVSAGSVS
jgi:hypothetical protein